MVARILLDNPCDCQNVRYEQYANLKDFQLARMLSTQFIHALIREYAKKEREGYYLHVSDIPHHDKKIFLSHIIDADDYADACVSEERLRAYFEEYKDYMQELINENLDEVYCEDMEEKGLRSRHHSDNGELYWVR